MEPLVLGYGRLAQFAGRVQFTAVQARLASYARGAGLKLGAVYFERDHTAPAAFADLLVAIERNRVTGVVVPSLTDFGDLKDERIAQLEDDLGVVVHAVDAASLHELRDIGRGL